MSEPTFGLIGCWLVRVIRHAFEPIRNQIHILIMTEVELAAKLTESTNALKAEIGVTADRVIAALNNLPTGTDVSPELQSAIDEIAADITKLKEIAAPVEPPPGE